MSYDYESCFWDPQDNGVNILLTHIQTGIKSCDTIEHFFKQRTDLERDYSRRLGAINDKLLRDIEASPDGEFGMLGTAVRELLSAERSRAKGHSKQSEVLYRQLYSDIKLFSSGLQAQYSTIAGKVEKLRGDKLSKKRGCEELEKRLEETSTRARDLKLNQYNIIGAERIQLNQRELAKWENNLQEVKLQLSVLKQEYKASQKHWLREWGGVTKQLQDIDTARIQFLQSKLQGYSNAVMETAILEQSKLDMFNSMLGSFTAMDDIAKFSHDYGTGRLKERHRKKTQSNNNNNDGDSGGNRNTAGTGKFRTSIMSNETGSGNSLYSPRDSHLENVRKLSSQLQQKSAPKNPAPLNLNVPDRFEDKPLPTPGITGGELVNNRLRSKVATSSSTLQQNGATDPDFMIISERSSTKEKPRVSDTNVLDTVSNRTTTYEPTSENIHLTPNINGLPGKVHSTQSSSTTSETSSNSTEFTKNVQKRRSLDSLTTSVSSMVSALDDTQRFTKSWNSMNRKRKSMNNINTTSSTTADSATATAPYLSPLEPGDKFRLDPPVLGTNVYSPSKTREISSDTVVKSGFHDQPPTRATREVTNLSSTMGSSSFNYSGRHNFHNARRKSMVLESSKTPIEDALYEMHRLQGSVMDDISMGRIRDNGMIITLPTVTTGGEKVIKYAKAIYPLMETNVPELAQFEKNDYLLIVEVVSDDWFRGEVYGNDRINPEFREGLIPYNFIQLLS